MPATEPTEPTEPTVRADLPPATAGRRRRVFVTGATGVVGRRVVPLLLAGGHAVSAIGRTPEKRARLAALGAVAVDVSLFDRDRLAAAVAGHDAVVNLATHIPPSTWRMLLRSAWRENDRVRREGAAAVVDAALAAGVATLVQESFAPIYEDGGDGWLDEESPVRPTAYNRSVLDAERAAARFTLAGGTGVVLRFGGFYGPDAFHVRDLVRTMRAGWAPMPGAAAAFWSSIAHDDAATAVVAALGAGAGVYNAADDEPLRRADFFDAMAQAFGLARPRPMPGWAARLMGPTGELLGRSQRIANLRLRAATGWAPRFPSAREGLRATAAAMRAAGAGDAGRHAPPASRSRSAPRRTSPFET